MLQNRTKKVKQKQNFVVYDMTKKQEKTKKT